MSSYKIPFHKGTSQPARYTKNANPDQFDWTIKGEFYAELTYEKMERGRSAAGFIFINRSTGIEYYLFMITMDEIFKKGSMQNGKVKGWWTYSKRGSNYGLKFIKP